MKLRIKGNSLRLRVTPSEMKRLLDSGRIEESIRFAPGTEGRLTYGLEHTPQTEAMTLRYAPGEVMVLVSSAAAQLWADGQDVGLYGECANGDGALSLAIEKDYSCLDKTDAENVDTFPNPNLGSVC